MEEKNYRNLSSEVLDVTAYKTVFFLTVSNRYSSDTALSVENELYCKVKPFREKHEAIIDDAYFYNFKDGLRAIVEVKKVPSKEAVKMEKASKGFCGHEWMIESIEKHGQIITED